MHYLHREQCILIIVTQAGLVGSAVNSLSLFLELYKLPAKRTGGESTVLIFGSLKCLHYFKDCLTVPRLIEAEKF
jgi:hypothetical protein